MSQNPDVSTFRMIRGLPPAVTTIVQQIVSKNGEFAGTTDASGQVTVTFSSAFSSTPSMVVATMSGADYFVRVVSKSASQVVFKVLTAVTVTTVLLSVSATLQTALTGVSPQPISVGVGLNAPSTATDGSVASSSGLFAAPSSGASATSAFTAPAATGGISSVTVATDVTMNTGTVYSSVSSSSGSFVTGGTKGTVSVALPIVAVANTSVTVDWLAIQ